MSITGVTVYKVSCSNLERSAAFYAHLGFVPAAPPSAHDGRAIPLLYGVSAEGLRTQMLKLVTRSGPIHIELIEWQPLTGQFADPSAPGGGTLGLRSDDLLGDFQRLKQAGVDLIGEPVKFANDTGDTWIVHVKDPDGFAIQLLQFVRKG